MSNDILDTPDYLDYFSSGRGGRFILVFHSNGKGIKHGLFQNRLQKNFSLLFKDRPVKYLLPCQVFPPSSGAKTYQDFNIWTIVF